MSATLPIPDFKIPADGWLEAAPLGDSPGTVRLPDGSRRPIMQRIDQAAADAMIAAFNAQDAATGLLLDFDHETLAGAGPAGGWILGLKVAPRKGAAGNALWCQVRPSTKGKEAIEGGLYRYLSITALIADCEDLGAGVVRPLRLDSIALTNRPNLKVSPITNSAAAAAPSAATHQESVTMDALKKLLGLPASATEADVIAAVTALQASATAALADAATAKAAIANAQAAATADLAEFAAVVQAMPAADQAAVKAGLIANREATRAALVAVGTRAAALAAPDPAKNAMPNATKPVAPIANSADAFGAEFDKSADLQAEFAGAGGKPAYVAYRLAQTTK
jgi:phage I-like protein